MLTKQENKVANLLGAGYSDKEVANVLSISTRTVINHKAHIFDKLNINKVTELVIWVWCQRTPVTFDLKEIRKQAIAVVFIIFLIPAIASVENKQRIRTTRIERVRTPYNITI